jgi:hypothetical protein
MKSATLPGFSAEASLYTANTSYRMSEGRRARTPLVSLSVDCPGHCPASCEGCMECLSSGRINPAGCYAPCRLCDLCPVECL